MESVSGGSMPLQVPRFVILGADFAKGVVDLLEGLDDLLRYGALDASQVRLVTRGRRVQGPEVHERLAELVAQIAAALEEQLEEQL
ncbi:MAG TPA: hypothetical protein VHM89_06830 [Acidimicrobiales bacterium]|nr:hypothetical protein [Acidimicrobiales bacterium]